MAKRPSKKPRLVAKSVSRTWREYQKAYARFREKGSPKSVHLLRIMTRRMMAMFDLFAADLPRNTTQRARKKSKDILSGLGPLRDVQVQLELLPQIAPDTEALEPFYATLLADEKRLSRQKSTKARKRIPGSVRRAVKFIEKSVETAPDGSLEPLLHHRTGVAFRAVSKLSVLVKPDVPATIHELRIAFKKFRYMAEFMAPVTPYLTPERISSMRNFQALMGDVQDVSELLTRIEQFQRTRNTTERKALKPAIYEIKCEQDARIQKLMRHLPELQLYWE